MSGLYGIVVTFRPTREVVCNIRALLSEVDRLVVVDNGSESLTLASIREMGRQSTIKFIEHGRNLGLAAALNRGIASAKAGGAEAVVLFDQDSRVEAGFGAAMMKAYRLASQDATVAIVMPKHIDSVSGVWKEPFWDKNGNPMVAITSGSLIPCRTFDICGWFEDDFIIDEIDEEYCLRARSRGLTIAYCASATLRVRLGTPRVHTFLGRALFTSYNYSPGRAYFATRNGVVVIRRYWRTYPRYCFRVAIRIARNTVKIALVEKQRVEKLWQTARGIRDGVATRMGMRCSL